MKSQKGVTLISLVAYIVILGIVVSTMAIVSRFFFKNVDKINKTENYPLEFNKFNMFFVNDVKSNKKANVEDNRITFEDGTIYEYKDNSIYRNGTLIASSIQYSRFSLGEHKSTENTTKNIITVSMTFSEEFSQTIEYVLKYW